MSTPYPPRQPQYGQPQYGQPQPHQQQHDGQSAIAVTTKFHWLAFMLGLFKPKLLVNGHQVGQAWGRTVIPVPPGQHHLHVHVPYLIPSRIGPADLTVPVHPGQTAELEYRAPMFAFSSGSLGPPPQKYNGMGATIGLMVAVLVIFCLCCVVSLAANA